MNLANAESRRFSARLEQPGRLGAGHVFAELVVVEHAAEFRDEKSDVARTDPHGQLVAVAGGNTDPHSGETGVLSNRRRGLLIELVESDDPVEAPSARHPGNGIENLLPGQAFGHQDYVFEGLTRPIGIVELVHGQQRRHHTHFRTLAHEVLALFVA